MLAVGLRKPHLPYRFPKPYLDMLPPLSETDVAQHWRLDASVPAIAHASGCGPQYNPYGDVRPNPSPNPNPNPNPDPDPNPNPRANPNPNQVIFITLSSLYLMHDISVFG